MYELYNVSQEHLGNINKKLILKKCPLMRGVYLREVSVSRGLTVLYSLLLV